MFKEILKIVLTLWLGSALITFFIMPPLSIYILTLPLVPFIQMDTYFNKNRDKRAYLEYKLKHSSEIKKELIVSTAEKICNLEHLDKDKTNGSIHSEWAQAFCTLENKDKIYFYKDCGGCDSSSTRSLTTGYVLVRDGEPIESIEIECRETIRIIKDGNKSDYYDRHVPIVEQLH